MNRSVERKISQLACLTRDNVVRGYVNTCVYDEICKKVSLFVWARVWDNTVEQIEGTVSH